MNYCRFSHSLDEVTLSLSAINICRSNFTHLKLNSTIFPISSETMELMSTQEYTHILFRLVHYS